MRLIHVGAKRATTFRYKCFCKIPTKQETLLLLDTDARNRRQGALHLFKVSVSTL